MLQGSLDNFALDEVLSLLSTTQKTGHLALSGDRGTGSLWLETGEIVGADASNLAAAAASDDVMFELLRFESGSFLFTMDQRLDDPGVAESVDLLLGTAKDRIVEWRTIEAVVPSLGHELWLTKSLEADEILLSRQDWDAVVAVGEGNSVGNVCELLGLDEVDGSRRIKGLIERGVLKISEPSETVSASASSGGLFAAPAPINRSEPVLSDSTPPVSDFAVAGVVGSIDEFEFLDQDALGAHDALDNYADNDDDDAPADSGTIEADSVEAMFVEEPAETASFGASLADAGVSADEIFGGIDAPDAPAFDASEFEAPDAPAFDASEFEAPELEAPEAEAPEAEAPAVEPLSFDAPETFGAAEMPARPPMPAPPAIGVDGSIQAPPPPPPPTAAAAFGEFTESAENEASLLMRYLKSDSH